jgi:DNA polymerase (family 10)
MPTPHGAGGAFLGAVVARALREIAALLALEPGNRFRSRAYERGAAVVASLPNIDSVVRSGRLTSIPSIGPALARTIEEIVRTGGAQMLERLRRKYPPGTVELSRVLSISQVRTVYEALGITTLTELRAACDAGHMRDVHGFGEKSERRLLERIDALAAHRQGVTLARAEQQGEAFRDHFRGHPTVGAIELAGAFRRRVETIDRLDLVVASDDPEAVAAHARYTPGIATMREEGRWRLLVHQAGGVDTDVHVVPARDFTAALIDATGSPGHIAKLAGMAKKRGLDLDNCGLRKAGRRLAVPTEAAFYERLDLPFIPPELREGADEVDAAAAGRLPAKLLRLEDIRGAVHCHTVWSDGRHSVEAMARAADAMGLGYLTITDHSTSASYARGLDADRLQRQWDEIARVQEQVAVRLLRGTESDILRDGSLDFPDAVLARLDVIIASVHNRHGLDPDQMTRRLVRAIRHPLCKIWGHPLGRYVLSRPPFACRMDEVLDAIAESRAIIEINGDPHRLDLAPLHIRAAKRRGIRFVVSADAHSTTGIANFRWGVDMARRGWLTRDDVLNTLEANEFAAAVTP